MDIESKRQLEQAALKANANNYQLFNALAELIKSLWQGKKSAFNRVLPVGEYLVDRAEKARFMGFGDGTTLYDSAVILGNVTVGDHTWIGPFVVLDGSGELIIGSHCSISAGVQIYSHDTVGWSTSGGSKSYEYAKTIIEDNCYIGPNCIIQKGVTIGEGAIIGANSFVNQSIPPYSKAYGNPAKVINR